MVTRPAGHEIDQTQFFFLSQVNDGIYFILYSFNKFNFDTNKVVASKFLAVNLELCDLLILSTGPDEAVCDQNQKIRIKILLLDMSCQII
ncbi:hypothetical protein BpHYR1_052989 [Brachionus plicatilis]|uniref:Uncharacterized protein n=1 Tax=Brachionus plicatilis TaxID=10195 RepID=A0A3M7SS91_BRAPC|nr:hypothetical protein BpHYR1_052989 [Brachionus plicatilis]